MNKKSEADSEADCEQSSDENLEEEKKVKSKKKARVEKNNVTNDPEQVDSPAPRKRGRPRKPVEETPKAVVTPVSQPFKASIFIAIDKPPLLVRGKTHKTDRHVAQEPRVEGPFTLIRSMKWSDLWSLSAAAQRMSLCVSPNSLRLSCKAVVEIWTS